MTLRISNSWMLESKSICLASAVPYTSGAYQNDLFKTLDFQ